MKWFVTDAQLAAMRAEVYEEARQHYQGRVDTWVLRTDAELARLRADRDAEVARLVDPTGPLVQYSRDEVLFWRRQFLAERQRADIAVDQCRVSHQNVGPVTQPPREDRLPREFPASEEQALAGLNLDGM